MGLKALPSFSQKPKVLPRVSLRPKSFSQVHSGSLRPSTCFHSCSHYGQKNLLQVLTWSKGLSQVLTMITQAFPKVSSRPNTFSRFLLGFKEFNRFLWWLRVFLGCHWGPCSSPCCQWVFKPFPRSHGGLRLSPVFHYHLKTFPSSHRVCKAFMFSLGLKIFHMFSLKLKPLLWFSLVLRHYPGSHWCLIFSEVLTGSLRFLTVSHCGLPHFIASCWG